MTATVVVSGAATGAITATVAGAQGPAGPSGAATNNVVDFVADCGADPTGAADIAAALDIAFTKLSTLTLSNTIPNKSTKLFIPPGKYSLKSNPVTTLWNFASKISSLQIVGAGRDASIFQFFGYGLPTLANIFNVDVSDLSFTGMNAPGTPDAGTMWELSNSYTGTIERCNFVMIGTTNAVLYLIGPSWAVRDCTFTACSCTSTTNGVIYSSSCASMILENVLCLDIGILNGYALQNKTYNNGYWFRHDDSQAVGSGYQTRGIVIRNCIFDEGCQAQIFIKGGPTSNVPYVRIETTAFNPPALAPQLACAHIENVDVFDVISAIDSGDAATNPSNPFFDLVSVGVSRLRKLITRPVANSNYLQADSGCALLEVEESPSLSAANLHSSATRTVVRQAGVKSTLHSSASAVTANQLVKMTSTGIATLGTADASTLLFGVTQDAAAGASVNVRVAKRGQRVTALSDGATTIAVGDQITNSAATAGQVKKSTSNVIGIALTAATNVAGTAFDIQLL